MSKSRACLCFHFADGHTTEDVIFMWKPGETEVSVGHKEMAQFEYKGSKLESDIDRFDSGQLKYLWHNLFPATTTIFA